ncbi:LytR/AlgR family response regulator transcription factor [Pedobacter nototheniae]|uniref:LytR/AlgR family response regulator transcription factor n=1 Tax=Pedobacter nototheniae TaxID=2488994 RepID=UPI001FE98E16|nr:LytTR family DNA-binding domain-containing protein [Pedobacter nototheniae]
MALTCIIIDDEPAVLEQLREYIEDVPELTLIKSYSNSTTALHEIMQMKDSIDILFTDIEMPELSGLELANKVRHKTKFLILVSGHLQYTLDGYKVKATEFLTKPFSFQKFEAIISFVFNHLKDPFVFIKIKENKELLKIQAEEIIYIKASGNYIIINTKDKLLTTLLKLSDMEEKLKDHLYFIRIHKSFIISTKHVEKFKNDFIYLSNGIVLSVGHTYKNTISNYFSLV